MRLQLTDEESSPLLDKEEIFYTLQEGIKQGHALVIAATCSNLSKRETHSVGLHPRHSYAVMEIGRAGVSYNLNKVPLAIMNYNVE